MTKVLHAFVLIVLIVITWGLLSGRSVLVLTVNGQRTVVGMSIEPTPKGAREIIGTIRALPDPTKVRGGQ